MKKILFFGMALMFGVSAGVAAGPGDNGSGLSGCCRTLQQECELNYGPAGCVNVYKNCMAARRCILP